MQRHDQIIKDSNEQPPESKWEKMYKAKYNTGSDDNSRNLLSRKLTEGMSGLKPITLDEAPSNIWQRNKGLQSNLKNYELNFQKVQ